MQQEIIDANSENLSSPQDIYKKLNKKYTINQIKEVLKNIDTNQIIGKKQENTDLKISISAPIGSFQADLTFYSQFKRQNHRYDILLTVIEINTRFAYVFPLKDKKAESILECLKQLYEIEQDNLKSISLDAGSEFEKKLVKNFLDQNSIKYIFFQQKYQSKRNLHNRTFQQNYQRQNLKILKFSQTKKLVKAYNNYIHYQIQMTPQKAKQLNFSDRNSRQNKLDVLQKIEEKFELGEFVRIFKNKELFQKGQKNYSKNIYQIIGREGNNYILKKFKDGKLLEKEQRKTAAYLQKINIFDLFSKQKVKKEISKQEVKKQTDFIKRILREGLDLENIIPDEQPPQRQIIKDILKMNQAELQSLKEKKSKNLITKIIIQEGRVQTQLYISINSLSKRMKKLI